MTWQVLIGDCRELMAGMADNSVDAIVCDPPYELSDSGEASATGIAFKIMLPQNPKFQSKLSGQCELSLFISEILALSRVGGFPCVSAAVPISAVALDNNAADGNEDVIDASIPSISKSDSEGGSGGKSETSKHLGCFALKCADSSTFKDALHRSGAGFISGGIGIGFWVEPSSGPCFFSGSASVVLSEDDVRALHDPASFGVSAGLTTEVQAVARLSPTRGTPCDEISAISAINLLALAHIGGAQIIRADATTSSLPTELEARRISVVNPSTGRAFTFDLIIHPVDIAKTGFMGKAWDGSKIAYDVEVWKQALRVLKPGGHLLAFSGSRTYHRMTVAIEDAGFEIRDQIMWVYGSGFPKSHDVSKAIDKSLGVDSDREITHYKEQGPRSMFDGGKPRPASLPASLRHGWGTALKPAHEPICMARKPLIGTIAQNVLTHGTGALNIDGCRIEAPGEEISNHGETGSSVPLSFSLGERVAMQTAGQALGRWPANLIHDGSDEAFGLFPISSTTGNRTADSQVAEVEGTNWLSSNHRSVEHLDSGSAARFFYSAKADGADRAAGLGGFSEQAAPAAEFRPNHAEKAADGEDGNPYGRWQPRKNIHPTVKPTDLMAYLCRLVTPPAGTVLDPFTGSGSTGRGAVLEGFNFIGCELSEEYAEIARARIADAEQMSKLPYKVKPKKSVSSNDVMEIF